LKSTDEEKKEMIDEILAPRPDGTSTVGIMLKDAFANFPLQKFLQAAKEPQRTQLFAEVGEQLADMKKFSLSYGKYLVAST
jgi:pumilio RNA-binding family